MAVDFTNSAGTGTVASDGFTGKAGAAAPFAGGLTVSGGNLTVSPGATINSAAGALTASTTHTQAGALALTAQCSQVSTVAGAGDAVKAPYAATPGAWFEVMNSAGVNALQLYGLGSDTLNGVAGTTGIPVAAGKMAVMTCFVAGAWVGPVALA